MNERKRRIYNEVIEGIILEFFVSDYVKTMTNSVNHAMHTSTVRNKTINYYY
jgi:hypothetical protein